jgi:hypothetical protein
MSGVEMAGLGGWGLGGAGLGDSCHNREGMGQGWKSTGIRRGQGEERVARQKSVEKSSVGQKIVDEKSPVGKIFVEKNPVGKFFRDFSRRGGLGGRRDTR